MELLLFVLVLGIMYQIVKPKQAPEKSPVDKVKDSIRAKEDGKINADEFFDQARKAIILDNNN